MFLALTTINLLLPKLCILFSLSHQPQVCLLRKHYQLYQVRADAFGNWHNWEMTCTLSSKYLLVHHLGLKQTVKFPSSLKFQVAEGFTVCSVVLVKIKQE